MPDPVKLSSPATSEFWEIPVLFEDEHVLVLNKPAQLLVSPDRDDAKRPNLIQLLHAAIQRGAPWAKQRGLDYLMNAHRLDFGTSGVMVLAKNKAALVGLVAQFGAEPACRIYVALVRGTPTADTFETEAKLAPHPLQMGVIRVDPIEGKRSHTVFAIRERFASGLLLECRPVPDRPHQVRAHLKYLRLPVVGDEIYGGNPLFLSTLKSDYEPKRDQEERPLIGRPALHAEQVIINHPSTGAKMTLEAPWPKDLNAAVKYLRKYAAV